MSRRALSGGPLRELLAMWGVGGQHFELLLASGPRGVPVPLSVWPKVTIRRPHTGTWHVVNTELGALETWVRTQAEPQLVTGTRAVDPLPPELDTTIGHHDLRPALRNAGGVSAAECASLRIPAETVRDGLLDVLACCADQADLPVIRAWLDAVDDDDDVLRRHEQLVVRALPGDPARTKATVRELVVTALRAQGVDRPS